MTALVWDQVGDRTYESGVDRGVLYLPDGSAIPWNGLISVVEHFNNDASPVYYDGMLINNFSSLGDFSATIRAITYPDEFLEFEGLGSSSSTPGVFLGDQRPKTFSLCYRTQIGNDVDGEKAGYKLHIVYNVVANVKDKQYASVSQSLDPIEFEWDVSAIPEELTEFGFAPSGHIVINTINIDPDILDSIEAILYGTSEADADLVSMTDMLEVIFGELTYLIQITDNGDNTWTADISDDDLLTTTEDSFEITDANAIFLDADTYRVTDTTVRE